jgi:hypothetical protein
MEQSSTFLIAIRFEETGDIMLNLENWVFGMPNERQLDSGPHLLGAAVGLLAFLIIGRPISDWFLRLLWVPGAEPLTCATLLEQTLIFIGSRALTLAGLAGCGKTSISHSESVYR